MWGGRSRRREGEREGGRERKGERERGRGRLPTECGA